MVPESLGTALISRWIVNLQLSAELCWIIWMAWGAGNLILRALRPPPVTFLERTALSAGKGLGIITAIVFLLGMTGNFHGAAFALLFTGLSAAGCAATLLPWPEKDEIRVESTPLRSDRTLFVMLAGGCLLTWLSALSPPLFYDALVYHLGVPNLYLLRGGIEHLPSVAHSNFPLGAEMIFLPGMFLGGPRLAVLINFGFGVLAAVALAAFVDRHWGRRRALIAVVVFYLTPMMFLLSRYAVSETALAFYFLLTILCLFRWYGENRSFWAVSAGIFGGLAFGTKYVGGIFAILLPAIFLVVETILHRKRKGASQPLRGLILFGIASAAAASPWIVKNVLFTGNPFYPALNAVFHGDGWGPEQARLLAESAHASWHAASSLADFLMLPIHLTVPGRDMGAGATATWFWPLAFLCSVALALSPKGRKERLLLSLFAMFLLFWGATFWMSRFLLPAMGLGAAVSSLALVGGGSAAIPRRFTTSLLVVLVLSGTANIALNTRTGTALLPSLGLVDTDDYLRHRLRAHEAVEYVNATLPEKSLVLVVGEARVAYLRRNHIFSTVFDRLVPVEFHNSPPSPAAVAKALYDRGVSHVLVNIIELKRLEGMRGSLPPRDGLIAALSTFLHKTGSLVLEGNGMYLYELPLPPPSASP